LSALLGSFHWRRSVTELWAPLAFLTRLRPFDLDLRLGEKFPELVVRENLPSFSRSRAFGSLWPRTNGDRCDGLIPKAFDASICVPNILKIATSMGRCFIETSFVFLLSLSKAKKKRTRTHGI
jgi:hypothetical protein